MKVINTVCELQTELNIYKDKSVGLVPTMGALHKGHLSLVQKCRAQNDISIVSIFVNPTQFNNPADLEKYPRTLAKDIELLKIGEVDIIFAPSVQEIYPKPDTRVFKFGYLDKVMEGEYRPGHFNGVAQVVSRLFEIVKPDKAYFGEKDFQQLVIIRQMVKDLKLPVSIISNPIVRETNGLAMSSRNQRLTDSQKNDASNIYRILTESKELYKRGTVQNVENFVIESLNKISTIDLEYFQVVDGITLQPVKDWIDSEIIIGCVAAYIAGVRLIDNIIYQDRNL